MSLRRLALGTLLGAFPGLTAPGWALELVADGLAGHVIFGPNVRSDAQLTALCASLRSVRADVLVGIDEEGGDVTRLWHRDGSPYPGNAALGVTDDPAVTTAIYAAIGADLTAVGINLDLAPVIDVNSAPDNPVIGTRSFGASAALVSRHAVAAVDGLRSAGVIACAKHFPGHGATRVDSHLELPTVDDLDGLPPFLAVAAAGVPSIMTAHIRVPSLTGDTPATFSAAALTLLREEIGFDGVIITDALEMAGAVRYSGDVPRGAVLALVAGADLLCIGARVTASLVEETVAAIIGAVSDGRLPVGRLEEAAARVAAMSAGSAKIDATSRMWHDSRTANAAGSVKLHDSEDGEAAGSVRLRGSETTDAGAPATSRGSRKPDATDLEIAARRALGLNAARRAIAIDGTLPDLRNALIIQFAVTTTIAEGRHTRDLLPHAANATSLGEILATAGTRPIVIAGRNLSRLAGASALIEALARANDVVVVEMGWPTPWRPQRVRAFVTTYGSSAANTAAVAELFGLISDQGS